MTKPTRLHPIEAPALNVSSHDIIMAALSKAMTTQEQEEEEGNSARGIAIIWLREWEDGMGNSFIIHGMNGLEAIGLLKITADDISAAGLGDYPSEGTA